MIRKPLQEITESDLSNLIADEIAEGQTIEYKRDLPGDTRDSKAEFFADVTSFANGAGGDLIFGIDEEKGVPIGLTGIEVSDADALGLRLENMCRDNVEPRLSTLQIKSVPLSGGRHVLVMRIGKSWNGPHRNKVDRHFYSRNSKGKYPLDVSELRNAFILGEVASERVRNFRVDRLAAITARSTPVPIKSGATIILHIVPIESFTTRKKINIDEARTHLEKFRPLGNTGYNPRLNLEGYLTYQGGDGETSSYTQVFRNGAVECVFVFEPWNGTATLWPQYETYITDGCEKFMPYLAELDFDGPVIVMVSILNVKDHALATGPHYFSPNKFPHNEIITPDVVIEPGSNIKQALIPIFEIVWNSFGATRQKGFVPPR